MTAETPQELVALQFYAEELRASAPMGEYAARSMIKSTSDADRRVVRAMLAFRDAALVDATPSAADAWRAGRDAAAEVAKAYPTSASKPIGESIARRIRALPVPASFGGDGWLPIETAPRDGTRLWLYWPSRCEDDRQCVGWWEAGVVDDPRWFDHADACDYDEPTHWRPLPAPPVAS